MVKVILRYLRAVGNAADQKEDLYPLQSLGSKQTSTIVVVVLIQARYIVLQFYITIT